MDIYTNDYLTINLCLIFSMTNIKFAPWEGIQYKLSFRIKSDWSKVVGELRPSDGLAVRGEGVQTSKGLDRNSQNCSHPASWLTVVQTPSHMHQHLLAFVSNKFIISIISNKYSCGLCIEVFCVFVSRNNMTRHSLNAYFCNANKNNLKRIGTAFLSYCLIKTSIQELLGQRFWLEYEIWLFWIRNKSFESFSSTLYIRWFSAST